MKPKKKTQTINTTTIAYPKVSGSYLVGGSSSSTISSISSSLNSSSLNSSSFVSISGGLFRSSLSLFISVHIQHSINGVLSDRRATVPEPPPDPVEPCPLLLAPPLFPFK